MPTSQKSDIKISLIDLATQVNTPYGYDFAHWSKQHRDATQLEIHGLEEPTRRQAMILRQYTNESTLYPDTLPGYSLLRKIAAAELFGLGLGWARPIKLKKRPYENEANFFVFKYENLLYYVDIKYFIERCIELKEKSTPPKNLDNLVSTDPLYPFFIMAKKDQDLKDFIDQLDINNKNEAAYYETIKRKFQSLGIHQYGWANESNKKYLIPSRLFTIFEKIDISAPLLTFANIVVTQTPDDYPWDLIGDWTLIFANLMYVPWIVLGLHRKLEISAYQYKYNGRNPETNGDYMAIIKKDSIILALQSLACSSFEGLVVDNTLMEKVGNFTEEILKELITHSTPQELKIVFHLTMAILCGLFLGLTMMGIAKAGVFNNPLYNPADQYALRSLFVGFLSGFSMYLTATLSSPEGGFRFAYQLLINPLVAMALHQSIPKDRYSLTPDEKHLPRNDIRPHLVDTTVLKPKF
jgi:hypothetical protein